MTPRFLIFAQHTATASPRSGIQRVTFEAALALRRIAQVDLVRWDEALGQLAFFDDVWQARFFDSEPPAAWPAQPRPPTARYRFGDLLDPARETWLLFPEIPFHLPGGNDLFARIVSQCREYGVRSAALFYDLIPARDADYAEHRPPHDEYLAELLRADLLLTISRYSALDLVDYYRSLGCFQPGELGSIERRIVPVPLGEGREDAARRTPLPEGASSATIVALGTIEPRKQQTRFLRVFNDLAARQPELARYEIELFGSLHPASAAALQAEMARNPRIRYRQYVPDDAVDEALSRAQFSVFISRSEGFGLPIVESLRAGVPCMTASFGAMAEVAAGGGCLQVDALSDEAIAAGIAKLTAEPGLRASLRGEIARRPVRTWAHYAEDIVEQCAQAAAREDEAAADLRAAVAAALDPDRSAVPQDAACGDTAWAILRPGGGTIAAADRASGSRGVVALAGGDPGRLSETQVRAVADADVIAAASPRAFADLVDATNRAGFDGLLPSRVAIEADPGRLAEAAARQAAEAAVETLRAREIARREDQFDRCAAAMVAGGLLRAPGLSIVISTFNRGPFVEANVQWLLERTRSLQGKVRIVVVDNTSTDDTQARLARFAGSPSFLYLRNPANVGMLGNLQVCSALQLDRYVWLTGDDDYILPGAIERALEAITRHPRVPLLVNNFGIYHRERLAEGDAAAGLVAELKPIAGDRRPAPTGLMRVNRIAEENDNLFTAIYPLIFRSDILAACFNYPFDGIPFDSLVESIPTTKIILESLRYCRAYWSGEIGIAGNIHNSWSHHRPRWHLVLMARAFDLARRAGVSNAVLWPWACLHLRLYEEGMQIAMQRNAPVHLDLPDDLDAALRVFRARVQVPAEARVTSSAQLRAARAR